MVDNQRNAILQREAEVYHETFQQITAEIAAYAKLNGIRIVRRAERSSKKVKKVDFGNRRAVLMSINRPVLFVDRGRTNTAEDITQPVLQRLLVRSKPETAPASDID